MKSHTKTLVKIASLILASAGVVGLAHAEPSTNFNVTVNPSISVSLSSTSLTIPELTPGTAADSNTITINVSTNSPNGYTLNASVGNAAFDTRDLLHKNTSVTSKFSSVATDASVAENTNLEDNTWAYSYLDESLNNGTNTTWSNYSGLPLYSDTTNIATIKDTTDPTQDTVKFKIAAKASVDQLAGEYNNVINFTAVAAPVLSYEALLDTGLNVNRKMKNLANNTTDADYWTEDTMIKTIAKADSLPTGFIPSEANTISTSDSEKPVYIFFDNTTGTMYYYTEANDIILNSDSSYMLSYFSSLKNIDDLAEWNTSSVTNMSSMFESPDSLPLTNIDALSFWDTSKVTNMSGMFYYAHITDINALSSWDTSKVTNMSVMFYGASQLTNIDGASSWDTSSVTSMSSMFEFAGHLTNINGARNWDTGNVTNISYMFSGVYNIDATALNNWDVSKVTDKTNAFACPANKQPSWY